MWIKKFFIIFCFIAAFPSYSQKLYSFEELYYIGGLGLGSFSLKGIEGLSVFVKKYGFEEYKINIKDSTFLFNKGNDGEQMLYFNIYQYNCRFATVRTNIALVYVKELKSKYQRLDIDPLHENYIPFTNNKVPFVIEALIDTEKNNCTFVFEEKKRYKYFSSDRKKASKNVNSRKVEVFSGIEQRDITVKQGNSVSILTTGTIRLGAFAGIGDANGIDGFTIYNKIGGFRHGSLLGRIGNGPWFFVGAETSFVADRDGILTLIVNDAATDDNDGSFTVEYKIR